MSSMNGSTRAGEAERARSRRATPSTSAGPVWWSDVERRGRRAEDAQRPRPSPRSGGARPPLPPKTRSPSRVRGAAARRREDAARGPGSRCGRPARAGSSAPSRRSRRRPARASRPSSRFAAPGIDVLLEEHGRRCARSRAASTAGDRGVAADADDEAAAAARRGGTRPRRAPAASAADAEHRAPGARRRGAGVPAAAGADSRRAGTTRASMPARRADEGRRGGRARASASASGEARVEMPAGPAARDHDGGPDRASSRLARERERGRRPAASARDHRRAAVGHERQRQPLGRQAAEHDADVHAPPGGRATASRRRRAGSRSGRGGGARSGSRARRRRAKSAEHERARPTQAELLADHREDEVGVRLRAGRTSSAGSRRGPTPQRPPEPKAMNDCCSWKLMPSGSRPGSRNAEEPLQAVALARAPRRRSERQRRRRPAATRWRSAHAAGEQHQRRGAPPTSAAVPKSGSSSTSPAIGPTTSAVRHDAERERRACASPFRTSERAR